MLEINQKGTIIKEVPQEETFTKRRIISVNIFEGNHVEINFVDSGSNGEKYQTVDISFDDYQKYLENSLCFLIDGSNEKEEE